MFVNTRNSFDYYVSLNFVPNFFYEPWTWFTEEFLYFLDFLEIIILLQVDNFFFMSTILFPGIGSFILNKHGRSWYLENYDFEI